MSYHFGAGNLYGSTPVNGVATAVKFAALQEFSIDFSFTLKELYGQNSFPLTIARGQGKITGKAKNAAIKAAIWNQLFFGAASAAGQSIVQTGEAAVIPTGASPSVTVANAGAGGGYVEDLGVYDASTGQAFARNSGVAGAGTYSVNAGTYQFAAADAGRAILIDYRYTVATGSTLTITNQLTGVAPAFALVASLPYQGQQAVVRFPNVYAPKLSFGTKTEDFVMPEMDLAIAANAAGLIGTISLPD